MVAPLNQWKGAPPLGPEEAALAARHGLSGWEMAYAPYDEATYRFVLDRLQPQDVVLDIGAGDCRLALAAASRVARVYAVEVHPRRVARCLQRVGERLPRNLQVICANALDFPFPAEVTVGVLLMRHCQHWAEFLRRLREGGARRLFTNARWGLAVEEIDLTAPRLAFDQAPPGWYACLCGAVGFKEPLHLDEPIEEGVHEVRHCPRCRPSA